MEVDVPRGEARRWTVVRELTPYVRDVTLSGQLAGAAGAGGFALPACQDEGGCLVRYRVLLGEAARELGDHDFALAHDGAVLSPPSSWMLHPEGVRAPFRLAVRSAPGEGFISGFPFVGSDPHEQMGDLATLGETPYAAFGALLRKRHGFANGGEAEVALAPARSTPSIDAWLDHALNAVASFYGRFPISHGAVIVRLVPGHGTGNGHTMGNGGGAVLVSVGESTTAAELDRDWLLIHELVHLSSIDTALPWADEGLATYLEPLIRARAGLIERDEIWKSLVEGFPQGQPQEGDRGLDHTDTWGRRYWGGAIFWFLADLEIRKATDNRRSLDDAMRALNDRGGNTSIRWDLDRVLTVAEEAIGAPVLRPLRRKLGDQPVRVDLEALWKSLGVSVRGEKVIYDDTAPLARMRQGIDAGARGGPLYRR